MNQNLRYAVSAACLNLARLEEDLKALEQAGADEVLFPVMDGQFAPGFAAGFDLVAAARRSCGLPLSAHLLVARPEPHIERFVEAGCATVTVHVEACIHAQRVLGQIRAAGAKAGIALNPATPLTRLEYLLESADRVLVLASDPGFARARPVGNTFERVRILRENIDHRKLGAQLAVAGAADVGTAAVFANAGADLLVLSLLDSDSDCADAFQRFKAALPAERHLR